MPSADLSDRLEIAKKEATLILQDASNWPKDSTLLVKELFEIISNAPTLQETPFKSPSITREAQDAIERFTMVMEDVCGRLNKAYKKYGSNRELSDVIRHPFSSLSKDGCATALLKCKDDVGKALTSLQDHLNDDPVPEQPVDVEIDGGAPTPNSASNHPTSSANTASAPTGPSTQPNLSSSTDEDFSAQQPTPSALNASSSDQNQEQATVRRRERMGVARTTFEIIEAISGTIPVVGSYVGAGAKVGLAVVKMIQATDSNIELVNDLETRTAQLSEILENFKHRSTELRREEFLRHLTKLQSELQAVRDKIGELDSQGTIRNVFCSGSQADALKGYQETIRVALEELQLLGSLNTTHLLNELYDGEVRKEQRRLLDRLGDASYGARGNAIDEVMCLPGTRVEVLERIDVWVRDSSSSERVLWIRGMAGRGKSTIASTVVNNWRYRAAFAIFHFRRGQNASDKRLVCSLARQLGSSMVPEVKESILQTIRENEDIAQERLQDQFKVLFVALAEKLQHINQPILIVVDALDECEDTKYAVDFVNLIHQHASSLSASFKFLLTTRPETPLLLALEPRRWRTEDLDVVASIDDDIAELLQHRLSLTRDIHSLGPEWPPQYAILSLVKMSQGLFQWAQTAVEYISGGSPELRLEELLESPSLCDDLDRLYIQILSKAYEAAKKRPGRVELLLHLLGTLVAAPFPVSPEVFIYLYSDQLMFSNRNQQQSIQLLRLEIACDVRSVVYIPDSPSQPMRLVHTSVWDLLVDKDRCGVEPFWIDLGRKHSSLTMRCLHAMHRDLRQNICGLSDLSKSNIEVQDVVGREVSNGLQYCCLSWSIHLIEGDWSLETAGASFKAALNNLKCFSEKKLLYWLEVMSLLGATLGALEIAKLVCAWLSHIPDVLPSSDLITIWEDARRFIASFCEPISFGALHIYASALPFCPTNTKIWTYYASQATNRILHGTQDITWPQSLWSRTAGWDIHSIVFLQDGDAIASGVDCEIRLWDSQTGTKLGEPLVGHDHWVTALVVSPDGQILASGSVDSTICLWDALTGDLLYEPLCGHTCGVLSLSFSSSSKILLSAARDHTIRSWDCQTGQSLGELVTYDPELLSCTALSPDSKVLASARCVEKTINLWDTQTGGQIGEPLLGHSEATHSLAFSPDNNVLASCAFDGTIKLWDSNTGACIHCPQGGSADEFTAIAFSPDGHILASGSSRGAIQLWNVHTGTKCGEYRTPHTSSVTALAFSPNGKFIASGSDDNTVQVCDFPTAPSISPAPVERKEGDRSDWPIASSSDGKMLASRDSDKHIRLWDFKTGELLKEHVEDDNKNSESLAFSSDGTMLAFGFDDGTLRLWNTETWTPLGSPLKCHKTSVTSIAFSTDGRALVSGCSDGEIRVWDLESWTSINQLQNESPLDWGIGFLTWSPDGQFIALKNCVKVIVLDAKTCSPVGPLEQEIIPATSLQFWGDQKLLVTGLDETVQYDLLTFRRCHIDTKVGDRTHRLFQDQVRFFPVIGSWMSFLSQRLFWLPPRYRPFVVSGTLTYGGRLAFVTRSRELFILDISRSLSL